MKRLKHFLPTIFAILTISILAGCTTTPDESCEQDEICSGKSVTACCNGDDCYYTYNGKKYGNDAASLAELASDLGCASASTPEYDQDIQQIIAKLQALSTNAKLQLY